MGAAREHGILDALNAAGVRVVADNGYQAAARGPSPAAPSPPRSRHRPLPAAVAQPEARSTLPTPASADPGERANAQLKSWRILRKIRCCPRRATSLVKAVLALILAG